MKLLSEGALPLSLLLVMGFFTQDIHAAQVDVDKREQIVLPGQNVTFMCRVAVPLQYCRMEIPGLRPYNLNRGYSDNDISYYGEGLDAGQCGFTLLRARDENNGEIKCTPGIVSEPQESVGIMRLVVAKPPKLPELELSQGADQVTVYKVDDAIEATCIVKDGRPVANISWFLGDEQLDDVKMPAVYELAKEQLMTIVQNVTRKLRASDNGKFLRCVAHHPAYPSQVEETKRRLDIKYAPLPQRQPIEEFGYEVGKIGVINVTVEANPRPSFEWNVDGQKIREGSHDNTGSMEAELATELGHGRYLASLRIARIGKLDTEKDYILTAYNDQGSQDYKVKISTNPEPKGFEVGIASIIGIVVAILFVILVISIMIFAKITGRWCFSGQSESRYITESSDTESAEVRPKQKSRKFPSLFFRSKSDKDNLNDQASQQNDTDEADADTIPADDLARQDEAVSMVEKPYDPKDKGLVYAELDLVSPAGTNLKPIVKSTDDKTEYAEIVYTPVKEDAKTETEDTSKEKKK